MKWLALTAAGGILLAAFGLYPFRERDAAQLLPVQTLVVAQASGGVRVRADNGLEGWGADYEAAMENLQARAPGEAFLATCAAVVLRAPSFAQAVTEDERLRPAAEVYLSLSPVEPEEVSTLLQAHSGGVRIADLRQGATELPRLDCRTGGWLVLDVS